MPIYRDLKKSCEQAYWTKAFISHKALTIGYAPNSISAQKPTCYKRGNPEEHSSRAQPQLLHSGPLTSSIVPNFFPPPPPPLGPPPPPPLPPPPPPPDLGAGLTPAARRFLFLTLKDDCSAAAWASSYVTQRVSRRAKCPYVVVRNVRKIE